MREILRLKYECGRSNREIGMSCGIGSSTVSDYLQRAKTSGLNWPLPVELNDTALEQMLFPSSAPGVASLNDLSSKTWTQSLATVMKITREKHECPID
jgi:hypothetical protein